MYPFTLLATWVHEMGHGMAALAMGGHFESLDIFANASGLAHTAAWGQEGLAVLALGGLLAPAIVGAIILTMSHVARAWCSALATVYLARREARDYLGW